MEVFVEFDGFAVDVDDIRFGSLYSGFGNLDDIYFWGFVHVFGQEIASDDR